MAVPDSLEKFFEEVRSSCDGHAQRKGYMTADGDDTLGEALALLGVERDHAIGEIITKLIEFRREPRKVLAVKAAGWCWRLWTTMP